ncbi:MAG: hypothetical protein JW904_08630 [Spirochaetales bacterium]|nr:hypothetical protein [Spirochaetales bacterium]
MNNQQNSCGCKPGKYIITAGGPVKRVSSVFTAQDRWGALKVRIDINRNNYRVTPGLYALNNPDETSPVFISANYKLSFDVLRKSLAGINGWILVLDTKGINVWCAAGKGTFGTEELIKQIKQAELADVVNHKQVIVPQLGAPGVAAHTVKAATGFSVVYGPVRAADLPAFLAAGNKADTAMRKVQFTLRDRFVLTPMEFVGAIRFMAIFFGILLAIQIIRGWNDPFSAVLFSSLISFIPYAGAFITATILFPLLLPILPGRAFALKGWILGLLWAGVYSGLYYLSAGTIEWQPLLPVILIAPALVAFITLNFTGASTYTSLSGVVKEMQYAVPAVIIAAICGAVSLILGQFVFA